MTRGAAYSGRVKRTAWTSRSSRAASRSTRLRPMKPVAPQTRTRFFVMPPFYPLSARRHLARRRARVDLGGGPGFAGSRCIGGPRRRYDDMVGWRVGVDSGGTFTDICLFNEDEQRVEVWKVASTPDDPSRGIAQG